MFDSIAKKVFWILFPFMIGGVIALVSLAYNTNTELKILQENQRVRFEIQQKTNNLVEINNDILNQKADAKENEEQHNMIIADVSALSEKLDRIYYAHYQSKADIQPDTTYTFTDSSLMKQYNNYVMNYE